MKKLRLFIAVFILLLLTACTQAPEKVKNDLKEMKDTKQKEEKIEEIKKIDNLQNIRKNTPKTFRKSNGLLSFDGTVTVPESDTMYKLRLKTNTGFYDNAEKVIKSFYETDTKKMKLVFYDLAKEWNQKMFEDQAETWDSNGTYYGVSNIGVINKMHVGDLDKDDKGKEWKEHYSGNNSVLVKNFTNVTKDNLLDEEYKLYDGNMSTKKAYSLGEDSVNKVNSFLPENHKFIIRNMSVYKTYKEKDYVQYYTEAVLNYKGVDFDHVVVDSQDSTKNNDMSVLGTQFEQNIYLSKKEPYQTSLESSFIVDKEMKKYNEFITFDSAWSILCNHIAKQRKTNIVSADLVYNIYFKDEKNYGCEWSVHMEEPPEFYAVPAWRFNERKDLKNNIKANSVFYINAITGKVSSFSPYVTID